MAVERFECQNCNITYIGLSNYKNGPRKFCSNRCKGESMRKDNSHVAIVQQQNTAMTTAVVEE